MNRDCSPTCSSCYNVDSILGPKMLAAAPNRHSDHLRRDRRYRDQPEATTCETPGTHLDAQHGHPETPWAPYGKPWVAQGSAKYIKREPRSPPGDLAKTSLKLRVCTHSDDWDPPKASRNGDVGRLWVPCGAWNPYSEPLGT